MAGDGPPAAAFGDLTATIDPKVKPVLPSSNAQSTAVTVRGRPGRYVTGHGESLVYAQLADGSWFSVVSLPEPDSNRAIPPLLTSDQLVAIADGIIIDPNPDLSWLGR